MRLKCQLFNSNLTVGKIYELDETNPVSNINGNYYYIKDDQDKYDYYSSYLFIELTAEVIANERNEKLKKLGI